MKIHELVVLQGAQGDLLHLYATRGERLYLQVDKALGLLRVYPEAGPLSTNVRIRRLVIPKTPLAIFYTIHGLRVLIVAVLDLRQSPTALRRRLEEG